MSEVDDVAAVLEAGISEARQRQATEARAQEADRLALENAFLRAGIPNNGVGRLFAQSYTGPADPREVKLSWAFIVESTAGLTPAEKVEFEMRIAQHQRGTR